MQAPELLSMPSSSIALEPVNSTQEDQMEREIESLAFNAKLQLEDVDNHNKEEEDEEFSFVCADPNGSPVSADDVFFNGQIRPVYPLFNRDLLFANDSDDRPPIRKVFVEKPESESETEAEEGSYCEWSPATAELVKKSNSTGFSKLRRFREFMSMNRSSSDGKDAFVFLTNPPNKNKPNDIPGPKLDRLKLKPQKATSSAHEKHYVRSRAQKQVNNRRSYLPYRQDLVGFFANANGFTKNVHPF